ncbi:DEAD/DEAH box helicase [Tranquillimonas alkanivorans]|uniref:ATP-dependent RNA helicase DeaD n=1 Tax=Tranquillimonas alkanivorans TaxID=441119 RepID=A0A1I5Q9F2_9RHOB|nr:DEAD/DEAH box helicase [Tranquillimonas alkanivorans]SFP42899.1 ATP-dependent RNA helicase DeaD [Tranquillimonas alkanivorans]
MIQTLSDALAERGYDTLTPVQKAVTDPDLQGADLLVSAQTGSGKTVGFGLAIGPTLLDAEGTLGPAAAPLALVVAPTRELAFQVMRELSWLYAKAGARVASCVGGMDMRDERRALERGAHIVVGTPGRLRDHIQRGSLDMSSLRAVVLDEADEMLDLGFREDLEFMLGEAPEERRTLMFSATVPPMIATLAQHYQRDSVRVTTLSDRSQHADIAYQALKVAPQDAENAIINVLRYHEAQNAIVFANTRATVNRLTARFANRGFAVVCLSGELSQNERSHALQAMRDGRARVCVATDVAARGIDLPNLELVIHAELPSNAEGLLHRSGRTGRAGRKGISALVVPPKAMKRAERLLKSARVTAEWTTAPDAEDILRRDEERLLSDPAWDAEMSEAEADFAARLLAQRAPEAVAAAYLRLYRTKHSAPEELSAPDARPAPRERAPFGPSAWVALSVGRDDRAEPRWLLPLLCRAGGLDKDVIGAIRVQNSETFVELAEARVPDFLASLGEGGVLEEGVKARLLDGAPEMGTAPAAARRATPAARPSRPAPEVTSGEAAQETPRREQLRRDPQPRREAPPQREPSAAPSKPSARAKPRATGPERKAKAEAGPTGGKRKAEWRPAGTDKRGGATAPRGKGPGTGATAPRGKGPGAGLRRSSAASDTSKRFTPPGGAGGGKPQRGTAGKRTEGGSARPTRQKR